MAEHNIVGSAGESLAAHFLIDNGFEIRERNFRVGHLEIDIIARKGNVIHFVEVKSRTVSDSATADFIPEAAFNDAKRERLMNAAQRYAQQQMEKGEVLEFSLDLIAVYYRGNRTPMVKYYQGLHF